MKHRKNVYFEPKDGYFLWKYDRSGFMRCKIVIRNEVCAEISRTIKRPHENLIYWIEIIQTQGDIRN